MSQDSGRSARAEHEQEIKELEERARQNPAGYRRRIVAWIALGYGAVGLAMLLGLAVVLGLVAIGWAMVASGRIHAGGIKLMLYIGIPAVIFVFALLRALFVRFPPPEGPRVSRQQAPALYALLDEMREKAGIPRLHEVVIDPNVNAAVMEVPRFGLLPWFKRYLILGLPLMNALSPDEFKAVVGHEFGHLSGAHGQLGSFTYRVRRVWLRLLQDVASGAISGGKTLFRFIVWYVPRLDKLTFVLARENEYEADALAADLTSPEVAGSALTRVNVAAEAEASFWEKLQRKVMTEPRPPTDLDQQMARALVAAHAHPEAALWRSSALTRLTDASDTHPSLSDRLRALGVEPPELRGLDKTAAEVFLGDFEKEVGQQLTASWVIDVAPAWSEQHQRCQQMREELEELSAKEDLSREERVEQARLLAVFERDEEAEALLRELLSEEDEPLVRFRLADVLLERGDEAGVEQAEAVIEAEPDAVLSAGRLLYSFYAKRGAWGEAQAIQRRMEARQELLDDAEAERAGFDPKADQAKAPALDPHVVQDMMEMLNLHPRVKEAYLFEKEVEHLPEHRLFVLGVKLKKKFFDSQGGDFGEVAEQLAQGAPFEEPLLVMVINNWPSGTVKKLRDLPDVQLK